MAIPLEIVGLIIDMMYSDSDDCKSCFSAASMISRQFQTAAQQRLFSRLGLSGTGTGAGKLAEVMSTNQGASLASYVMEVTLFSLQKINDENNMAIANIFDALIEEEAPVSKLELLAYPPSRPIGEYFSFLSLHKAGSYLIDSFLSFDKLTWLKFFKISDLPTSLFTHLPPNLTTLELINIKVDRAFTEYMPTAPSGRLIKSLGIANGEDFSLSFRIISGITNWIDLSNVERLSIDFDQPELSIVGHDEVRQEILDAVALGGNLKELNIRAWGTITSVYDPIDLSMHTNLQEMTFYFACPILEYSSSGMADLSEFLTENLQLPASLTALSLVFPLTPYDPTATTPEQLWAETDWNTKEWASDIDQGLAGQTYEDGIWKHLETVQIYGLEVLPMGHVDCPHNEGAEWETTSPTCVIPALGGFPKLEEAGYGGQLEPQKMTVKEWTFPLYAEYRKIPPIVTAQMDYD